VSLHPSDLATLGETRLFGAFDGTVLSRLGPYVDTRTFEPGEPIIWEGSRHRALYVLADGTATVSKTVRGDVESVLARLGPGSHFGELALIDGRAAAATVTADSACRVFSIDSARLQGMLESDSHLHAALGWRLLESVASRLRATNVKVQEAVEWGLDMAAGPEQP
jgi:CRP-like cAMP-binding protein